MISKQSYFKDFIYIYFVVGEIIKQIGNKHLLRYTFTALLLGKEVTLVDKQEVWI